MENEEIARAESKAKAEHMDAQLAEARREGEQALREVAEAAEQEKELMGLRIEHLLETNERLRRETEELQACALPRVSENKHTQCEN